MKTKIFTPALALLFVNTVFAATYSAGHADLGLGEGDKLELHLHIHEGSVMDGSALLEDTEYEPGQAVIAVPTATLFPRPDGTVWNLIGNHAGDDTWSLPASGSVAEAQGAPYLGIGAEEVTLGAFVNNELTLALTGVSGPGVFSLYTESFGIPTFPMSSFDGISAADTIILDLDVSDHVHFNYGFSATGVYQVTFQVSAIDSATQTLVTDEATFTFHVVPEPATSSLLVLGTIGLLRKK